MAVLLALTVGVLVAGSIYLMLSRNLVRFIFGLTLASNAVNLLIFSTGQVARQGSAPPLIPAGQITLGQVVANALPQALVLTAIVIGFALLTFVFVLFYRAGEALQTVNTEQMRVAEPLVAGMVTDGSRRAGSRRAGPRRSSPRKGKRRTSGPPSDRPRGRQRDPATGGKP